MSLRDRVQNILMRPQQEWQVIAREPSSVAELYLSYVAPLAAIGPLASVVGLSVIGYGSPVTARYRVGLGSSITQAIVTYVGSLIGVYVLAFVIDRLTPIFSGWEDELQAFKLAAYSSTAAWLAGVFRVIPALDILVLLGLYSLYLLYVGVPVLLRVPQRNVVGYTATVIIAAFVIFFVISVITSWLFPQPTLP
jgi:Yip1-like protein